MEKYLVCAEGGSALVGNKEFQLHIPNGYGDGDFFVEVYEEQEEFASNGWNYVCMVKGSFNIYRNDYDNMDINPVLATLNGTYIAYCNSGDIALLKSR